MLAFSVCCTPSNQAAGEGESVKEVAVDKAYKLGPIRDTQPGESAIQIPPHHCQDDGIS